MDTVRDLIAQKLKDRGISMKEASERLGRNAAYIQQFIERGVPKQLPEDLRPALASMLDIAEPLLRGKSLNIKHQMSATHVRGFRHVMGGLSNDASEDTLKVLGMAECGPDGWSLWNGEVIDRVPRPPWLTHSPQAYAVYAVGSSMQPRYEAGELIYVHPGKPVTPGCYVLVQLVPIQEGEPPRAVLKRLVKRTGNKVILSQFQPEKTFELKADEIVSMHRVVGSGEA
jgi:SOS-response transcriptional repressor LexA